MNTQELILAVQNGLKFEPMTDSDYQIFAGAEKNSLVAYSDIAAYILCGNTLSVISEDYQNDYVLENTLEIEI